MEKEIKNEYGISIQEYIDYKKIREEKGIKLAFEEIFLAKYDKSNDIKLIMNEIIVKNGVLKYWNNTDIKDVYEKFDFCFNSYETEISKKLGKAIIPILDSINIPDFKKIFDGINLATTQIQNSLKNLSKIISEIKIPSTSEIKEKIEIIKKWGYYGWTIIPSAPINMYYKNIDSLNEANDIAIKYLEENEILKLFNYISKYTIQKNKFLESIKCYKNGSYLASSLILIGIIERELTEKSMFSKEEAKPRGKAIVPAFKNKIYLEEDRIIQFFYYENLFNFLEYLFENGNDFKTQPEYLNRNYFMHGWWDNEVTEIENKKLILALYNILKLYKFNEKFVKLKI